MKKIVSLILIFTLVLTLGAILTSCDTEDENGFTNYADRGLKFRLPNYFRRRSFSYVDIAYTTNGASFEVEVMTREEIEDPELQFEFDFDITVKEYTEFFINENGWDCDYEYDEARDAAQLVFFWTPDPEVGRGYYHITILKGPEALYCVVMSCDEDKYENYGPLFVEWSSYLGTY